MRMGTSWRYGERDYRAIEDALLRTDYGRWFLGQYLGRNRREETERLLDALDRLEASFAEAVAADPLPRLREIAAEIDAEIEATLSRLSSHETAPEPAGDAPVESILEAVEDINGFLETLHARRVNLRLTEKIRGRLSDIQAACARVDTVAEPGLAVLLADLRQRLAGFSEALATENAQGFASAPHQARVPQRLIDELSAAFFGRRQAPVIG